MVIGSEREAAEQARSGGGEGSDAIVLASGGLGLISLPEREHRMTRDEIDSLHPRLLGALAGHPGIGFVMVRDGPAARSCSAARAAGSLATTRSSGEDPLAAFGPNAADHLRRTDSFPHCPDILVNCVFDPDANEVAPFEEFMGSHGGLGGWQTHPFALVPAVVGRTGRADSGRPRHARSAAGLDRSRTGRS